MSTQMRRPANKFEFQLDEKGPGELTVGLFHLEPPQWPETKETEGLSVPAAPAQDSVSVDDDVAWLMLLFGLCHWYQLHLR
jgi:hypothetical protein